MNRSRSITTLSMILALTGCRTMAPPQPTPAAPRSALVLSSDFGLRDGAVSEMRGVAFAVDPQIPVSDLTHEIPPFSIWQAALRLQQTYRV